MVSPTISTEVPAHLQSLLDAAVASAHEPGAIAQDFSPLNEWFVTREIEECRDGEILGPVFDIGEGSFFSKVDDEEAIFDHDFGTQISDTDEWEITDADRIACSRKQMAYFLENDSGYAACTTELVSSTGQRALAGWMIGPYFNLDPRCEVYGYYANEEAFKVALNARNQWLPEQITDQMILDSWPRKKTRA